MMLYLMHVLSDFEYEKIARKTLRVVALFRHWAFQSESDRKLKWEFPSLMCSR